MLVLVVITLILKFHSPKATLLFILVYYTVLIKYFSLHSANSISNNPLPPETIVVRNRIMFIRKLRTVDLKGCAFLSHPTLD